MYPGNEDADPAFGGECPGSNPEEVQKEYALGLLKTGSFGCKPDTRTPGGEGKSGDQGHQFCSQIRRSDIKLFRGRLKETTFTLRTRLCAALALPVPWGD